MGRQDHLLVVKLLLQEIQVPGLPGNALLHVGVQVDERTPFNDPFQARGIPVGNLDTDENPEHDDGEVDPDGKPVLSLTCCVTRPNSIRSPKNHLQQYR